MDISALLLKAASLMLTGMIGVFVFLSILIIAVRILSKFAGNEEPEHPAKQQSVKKNNQLGISNAHIAAISAAVSAYRKNN